MELAFHTLSDTRKSLLVVVILETTDLFQSTLLYCVYPTNTQVEYTATAAPNLPVGSIKQSGMVYCQCTRESPKFSINKVNRVKHLILTLFPLVLCHIVFGPICFLQPIRMFLSNATSHLSHTWLLTPHLDARKLMSHRKFGCCNFKHRNSFIVFIKFLVLEQHMGLLKCSLH